MTKKPNKKLSKEEQFHKIVLDHLECFFCDEFDREEYEDAIDNLYDELYESGLFDEDMRETDPNELRNEGDD